MNLQLIPLCATLCLEEHPSINRLLLGLEGLHLTWTDLLTSWSSDSWLLLMFILPSEPPQPSLWSLSLCLSLRPSSCAVFHILSIFPLSTLWFLVAVFISEMITIVRILHQFLKYYFFSL